MLIEINDKDEREKTTYFVVEVKDPEPVRLAIHNTWLVKDYTVKTLKDKLDLIPDLKYLYACTNPTGSTGIVEMGL